MDGPKSDRIGRERERGRFITSLLPFMIIDH